MRNDAETGNFNKSTYISLLYIDTNMRFKVNTEFCTFSVGLAPMITVD